MRFRINRQQSHMATIFQTILSRLFGGAKEGGRTPSIEPTEHKGFLIVPAPYPSRGQFQTAGVIAKEIGSDRKEHRFVRAETHASLDDAVAFSIAKGRQIIDEQGDRLFT
jgi:hypothetical protein